MRFALTWLISLVAADEPGGDFQAASLNPAMTIRGARTRLGVVDMRGT